jgi:hypothetical protein
MSDGFLHNLSSCLTAETLAWSVSLALRREFVLINKGTRVFNVSPLKSTISFEGNLEECQLNAVLKSVAASLSRESEMVECNGFEQIRRRQAGRRAPVIMTFTVYVESDKKQQISDFIGSEEVGNLFTSCRFCGKSES